MQQDFLRPRLVGGRFEEHSLPLDVMKDWAAFEELVIEIAKDIYRRENRDRKRTPRGFTDDFSLHLTAVEPGSAIPVLKRYFNGEKLAFSDHFDRALALVQAAIIAVNLGQAVPVDFPREYLGYFNRFGSSLREGEHIEWPVAGTAAPVIYDRKTRKKLVLTGAKSYQAATDLRGWITEVNAEKNSYSIKLIGGPKLIGSYPRELANPVLEALREFQREKFQCCKVLVRGLADFDLNDQPVKVAETQHIELLDPNDVAARCEELAQLKDGWLDGDGKAPTKEGLDAFTFMQAGRVTSQAFHPTPKDKDLLSAYDGDLIGAEAAWTHYTQQLGMRSAGVLVPTVAECETERVPCRPDPELFLEHAVIDFTGKSKKEKKEIASLLRDRAVTRDWLFEGTPA